MSTAPTADHEPLWHDELWDELLAYIEDRHVIPIVGPDLIRVDDGGRSVTLDRFLAARLSQSLNLSAEQHLSDATLNDIISAFLRRGGRRETIAVKLVNILRDARLAPPESLRQLAAISHLTLFVTTNFDSLLEAAIDQERFGGRAQTQSIAYAPGDVHDLPADVRALLRPVVYHLFGKLSPSPSTFAVSEEDVLEFFCGLQAGTRPPALLFDGLKTHHLLLLGSHFPDWLARFFLRLTKGHRLSAPRTVLEIVADDVTRSDTRLVSFLNNFSPQTKVFEGGGVAFIAELSRRWQERFGGADAVPRASVPPPEQMPPRAVFLSYAREDRAAIEELAGRLAAAGIDFWYDLHKLGPGENFDHTIWENIRHCGLFVPLLSQHTEQRREGYFRTEWWYAEERARMIDPGRPFIVPVVVDDTREPRAVLRSFQSANMTWAAEGRVEPAFVEKLRGMLQR